jgi:hypothetical protein
MYVGPETVLPLSSALAAIAGIAVMFWHKTVSLFRGAVGLVARVFGRR